MKPLLRLSKKTFPEKFTCGGAVDIERARITLIENDNDVITGATVDLYLEIDYEIDGLKLQHFQSKTTHILSEEDFNKFMDKICTT